VAGKTGTTSSNKDGWFIGFSSGLTAGVWMGRDDAKTVGGLQGGTAPARAFHDFMTVAVANRPVEPFQTQVPMPDWQLTPEEEMYGDTALDMNAIQPMVDENGNPLPQQPLPQQPDSPPPLVRPDGTGEPPQQELDPGPSTEPAAATASQSHPAATHSAAAGSVSPAPPADGAAALRGVAPPSPRSARDRTIALPAP
jgi:penicillin-binding protein 1A